jgi:hypothetical protein
VDITRRKRVRETLLVDSALVISAYVAIARKMHDLQIDLSRLEKLGETVTITVKTAAGEEHRDVDLFSRENPIWEQNRRAGPLDEKNRRKGFHAAQRPPDTRRDAENAGSRARLECSPCCGSRR